eukprot:snap_masked-scaffold_2-processed-gene-19.7-mRNA-1 protein AED:1.00 eAED:1.00 QI:0/0/0/0/1/1/2/0/91
MKICILTILSLELIFHGPKSDMHYFIGFNMDKERLSMFEEIGENGNHRGIGSINGMLITRVQKNKCILAQRWTSLSIYIYCYCMLNIASFY